MTGEKNEVIGEWPITQTVLVVAGNHSEFVLWARDESNKLEQNKDGTFFDPYKGVRYIFISVPDKMRGYHGVEVALVGTAYERDDYSEFLRLAEISELP